MSNTRDEAKKWFTEAGRLFEESNFKEAARLYTQAVSIDPGYASAYFNRALCHAHLEEYEEAEKDLKKVLDLEPEAADARYVYGLVYEYQHRYVEAGHRYLEALEKDPSNTRAKERLTSIVERLTKKPSQSSTSEAIPEEAKKEFAWSASSPPKIKWVIGMNDESTEDKVNDESTEDKVNDESFTRVVKAVDEDGILRMADVYQVGIGFTDVVGLSNVKRLIEDEVILPHRHPEAYAKYNKQPRISLLLYGPPGNGKTLLAQAVAGELEAPFIPVSANEVLNRYVGDSERNLHRVFEQALSVAASGKDVVIFIDELDALGSIRMSLDPVDRKITAQLLLEVERAVRTPHVVLLGSTNRPWDVDPALKRGGRFERTVYVSPPGIEDRLEVLKAYLGSAPIAQQLDLAAIARRTEGYSCADLMWLVDRAKTIAVRREIECDGNGHREGNCVPGLVQADLEEALAERPKGSLSEWFLQALLEARSNPVVAAEYPELFKDVKRFAGRTRATHGVRGTRRQRSDHDKLSFA